MSGDLSNQSSTAGPSVNVHTVWGDGKFMTFFCGSGIAASIQSYNMPTLWTLFLPIYWQNQSDQGVNLTCSKLLCCVRQLAEKDHTF